VLPPRSRPATHRSRPRAPGLAALAALALLLAPSLAAAHDLWLEREGGALALRRGHRHGTLLPLERAKVKALRCLEDGATRDVLSSATAAAKELRLAARCQAASAAFDGGAWSLTPEGEVNRPRSQVQRAVRSWLQRQYAKWVDAGAPGAAGQVFGDELELVVVGGLAGARAGERVTVRVLSAGVPVAGAALSADHDQLGETDAAGEARVPLRAPGVETLSAKMRRRVATPDAEVLLLQATLTFEVAR
jgi:uncharacterized GH25 family protein